MKTIIFIVVLFIVNQAMFSNQKLAVDLLIAILATFILSTTILSISTNNWNIKHDAAVTNRTGLFQQCSNSVCCDKKELNRSITLFALFSIVLLSAATLASFLLMATTMDYKNRCYIHLNGYSAYTFMINTILAYFLGGLSLVHANMFYF